MEQGGSKRKADESIEIIQSKKQRMTFIGNQKEVQSGVTSVIDGKTPFLCKICDKNFAAKNSLQKHVATIHEGAKPYQCEICKTSYTQKGNLKKHQFMKE